MVTVVPGSRTRNPRFRSAQRGRGHLQRGLRRGGDRHLQGAVAPRALRPRASQVTCGKDALQVGELLDVESGSAHASPVWTAGAKDAESIRPVSPRRRWPWLDAVHRFALRLTRDATAAEDLVQDTFQRAYLTYPEIA